MSNTYSDLSDEQLGDAIVTWAGRVAAGKARLIALIGEYDARGAWAQQGMLSCAHWVSWRLGVGLNAAREMIRVAARLRELPTLSAAFAAGRLSWSQVRAISRVQTDLDEDDWILYARQLTGQQLERLVQAVNSATRGPREAADPEKAAWQRRPRIRRTDDGLVHITFVVDEETAPVILAALERTAAEIREERVPEIPAQRRLKDLLPQQPVVKDRLAPTAEERASLERWREECDAVRRHNAEVAAENLERDGESVTFNHALLRLATAALDQPGSLPLEAKERLRTCVDPVSGWARTRDGALLPPGSVAKPAGPFVPLDLTAFDLGRTSRHVSLPLRRLLGDVDGERCRFPGCSRVAKLHAHHVRYWSHGGPTDLANLVLVCSRHHTLIHAEGYQLVLSPDRQLTVRTAADIPVPHLQTPPVGDAEELPDGITATTLPPQLTGEPIDWDWAVYVIAQTTT